MNTGVNLVQSLCNTNESKITIEICVSYILLCLSFIVVTNFVYNVQKSYKVPNILCLLINWISIMSEIKNGIELF